MHASLSFLSQPVDRAVPTRQDLHNQLDLQVSQQDWQGTIVTLTELCVQETEPQTRARFCYSAALICRDHLHSSEQAVSWLNKALEESPDDERAFSALERLLQHRSDWRSQRRLYRRYLRALSPGKQPDREARLWSAVGTLSAQKLDDPDTAALAFETATRLTPTASEPVEKLANLYVHLGPSSVDKAIAWHQHLVHLSPDHQTAYGTLAQLFSETGDRTRQAWATAAQQLFGEPASHAPAFMQAPAPPLDVAFSEATWQALESGPQDKALNALLSLSSPGLLRTASLNRAQVGLALDEQSWRSALWAKLPFVRARAMTSPSSQLTDALKFCAHILGVPQPELQLRADHVCPLAVQAVHHQDRSYLLLIASTALKEQLSSDATVFALATRTALMRPRWIVHQAFSDANALGTALRALLTVSPHGNELAALPQSELISRCAAWLKQTQATADRAALLLTGDLGAAAEALTLEAETSIEDIKSRLATLAAFAVSNQHLAIRQQLEQSAVGDHSC